LIDPKCDPVEIKYLQMKKRKIRRRNPLIDLVNGLLSLFILAIICAIGLVLYFAHSFYAEGPVPAGTTFYVEEGDGLNTVASRLERDGLISSSWIFRLGTRALKTDTNIRHGEYALVPNSSMAEILKTITEGKPIEYTVTIPEGFTSWQVVERLKEVEALVGDIENIPAEGSLLPNTYVFRRGDHRDDVIAQMAAAQQKQLEEIWETRAPGIPVDTPEELVILASIVEKETGIASERPEVAAVFINRLNKGMRLQSDPTIIYGLTLGQGSLGRGLLKSEIEAETPYNTYVIGGLPAGPIANPGVEAMKAVANPANTKSLYFVAAGADPSQGHLFADSYDEHRKNVAAYRKALRDAQAQEEADAEAARDALQAEEAETGSE
jgi:UPF0755 protein